MLLKPVDWAILRELLRWEGNQPQGALRFPVADLAQRTGAHPNTVRARLIALREGGVVEGAAFDPWPRMLGLVRSGWMFPGIRPPGGARLEAFLRRYPRAQVAVLGLDWLFTNLWEATDADAQATAEAMARDLGCVAPERHFTSSRFPASPADDVRLSNLDGRLVVALRQGPQRSLAEVAKGVGISARMAERRAKRLFDAGAGGMMPLVRPSRIEGVLLCHFLLKEGGAGAVASLAKAFPDRIAGPFGEGINAGVMVPLPNLEAAEKRRAEAEGLPGIARLDILVYRDIVYSQPFEAFLAERVAAQQVAVASP